jgi:hypothetical protein
VTVTEQVAVQPSDDEIPHLFADPNIVQHRFNQILVAKGWTTNTGQANSTAFKQAAVDLMLALPVSNGKEKNLAGSFGNLLHALVPELDPDPELDLEDRALYQKFYLMLKGCYNNRSTSTIQKRAAEKGRFLCSGDMLAQHDTVQGVWITDNFKRTGPAAEQYERRVSKWGRSLESILVDGDAICAIDPEFSKVVIGALEARHKAAATAITNFKAKALAIASGNGAEAPDPE